MNDENSPEAANKQRYNDGGTGIGFPTSTAARPNTRMAAPSAVKHEHPCICDVRRYRREAPSREQLRKLTANYLRNTTLLEEDEPAMTEEQKEELRLKRERRKRDKVRRERLARMKHLSDFLKSQSQEILKRNVVDVPVEGTNYRMEYILGEQVAMKKRRGFIGWKKDPYIQVRPTRTSELRKTNLRYCGQIIKRLAPFQIDYDGLARQRTLPTPSPL